MIVQLSVRAKAEYDSALAFLDARSPSAADTLQERIETALASLTELPGRGRPGGLHGARELPVRNTPYVVVYTVEAERVSIIRIRHISQDPSP